VGKVEEAVRSTALRLVRRELRGVVAPLQQEVRDLKRTVSRLNKTVSALETVAAHNPGKPQAPSRPLKASAEELRNSRLSPRLIRKLRMRLGLTQVQLAGLLGVTGAAVAQWETAASAPRGENRSALIALRKLGRRDVQSLLAEKGIPPARRGNRVTRTTSRAKRRRG
jgi:DNA-binding transcriptional regulator YiaG